MYYQGCKRKDAVDESATRNYTFGHLYALLVWLLDMAQFSNWGKIGGNGAEDARTEYAATEGNADV